MPAPSTGNTPNRPNQQNGAPDAGTKANRFAEKVQKIRQQVHQRLIRLSNASQDAEVFQSFLCREDHLCGVRFLLKDCHALWLVDDPVIKVFRQGELVDEFSMDESQRRAA